MHPFRQHTDGERTNGRAAQAGRQPQSFVIPATRIEADHQTWAADARRQMIHVKWQIGTAQFFARLDENYAARMGYMLVAERKNGSERAIHGIAVIGATPAVKSVSAHHRGPGPQPSAQPVNSGCLSRWP